MDIIKQFLNESRMRLWKSRCINIIGLSLLTGSAVLLIVSLSYVLRGYAVDLETVVSLLSVVVIFTLLICLSTRPGVKETAHFADNYFGLNDSILSMMAFSENDETDDVRKEFIELQKAQTAELCKNCDVDSIPVTVPKKSYSLAVLFLIIGLILCSFDDSDAVKDARAADQALLEVTEDNKKEVEEELKKIEDSLTEEEKELFESDDLKELVEKLEATSDKKEALRQYARLEQEVRRLTEKTKLREEEKLLAELARQLQKSKDLRSLGRLLQQKKYKKAAEEMQKMKVNNSKSLKNQQKMSDLLKSLSRKMKESSDLMKANQSSLKQDISKLDKASDELQKALKQAMKEQQQNRQCSKNCRQKCAKACKNCNNSLQKMCCSISRTGTKSSFMKKMSALQKALAKAQQKANNPKSCSSGMCMMPGQSPASGKKPGSGSMDSKNTKKSSIKPGYETQLQGEKGDGPSQVEVQNSETGTGVGSGGKARQKSVDFEKQMESFIDRTDVPHEMKNGVKEYFKIVHENDQGDQ